MKTQPIRLNDIDINWLLDFIVQICNNAPEIYLKGVFVYIANSGILLIRYGNAI